MNWIDIDGFEGKYQMTTDGKFRSVEHTIIRSNGFPYTIKCRPIATAAASHGYLMVHLSRGASFLVHRLLASQFIANPCRLKYVNHKDGNILNNNLDNLEWVSARENATHAYKSKRELPSGVYRNRNGFYSQIFDGKRNKHLGNFSNIIDAVSARDEAMNIYGITNKYHA